jgi:hypothetical protein
MLGKDGHARVWSALLLALIFAQSSTLLLAQEGEEPADPFGPPEGPIPFPIFNVSSSYDEDRFPYVHADSDSIRVIWNKGARDMFVYHVVQRSFDGEEWQDGEDWVSVIDPQDQDFVVHEHYSHEGMAVGYKDKVYFVFASDDQNYTTGSEHDIALRSYDPGSNEWGPIVEVTPNDEGQDREPRAAVLDGKLVIVWRTNDPNKAEGSDDDLVMRTYDGAAFSEIVPVSPEEDGTMDARHDLAVIGDRLSIVWEWNNKTNGPSDWDVMYRQWDGTAFTGDPVPLSPEADKVTKLPRIAHIGDDPFVVWESRPPTGQPGSVAIRGCRVVDGAPGPLVAVTRPGSSAENVQPDVVSAGGKAYILWSSFDDSITHGPDSDIVMREYDGETLGDVVEVSHPRDGPEVNEGFVVACVFRDNLYAVWRMMYPVDPGLPLDVPVNEDIVMRRVTDHQVVVTTPLDANPQEGDTIPVRVKTRTFYGAPDDGKALGVTVQVLRDLEVLPGKVDLTDMGDGVQEGSFLAEEPGTYKFVVRVGDREVATTSVTVLGGPGDGNGDDGMSVYVWYTLGAVVLLAIALVIAMRRRG